MKKAYINESETFDAIYASSSSISTFNQAIIKSSGSIVAKELKNSLWLDGYYFEDSDDYLFKTLDLFYRRSQVTEHISLGVDAGLISLERRKKVKYNGIRYGATLFYDNFSFRLGRNDFDDFSEIVPTFRYDNSYKRNDYSFEYTRQNALFYTYSEIPYEKEIKADHFSLTDNVGFENNTTLWMNLEVNFYSNDDREVTFQFDYLFFRDTLFTPRFTYSLALEGWYTIHSEQHNDFYSPDFADATLIRIDPQFVFAKAFALRGKLGVGYSYSDSNRPYKYGLWAFGEPIKNIDYSIGCLESNAARIGYGKSYNYLECDAHLGYRW